MLITHQSPGKSLKAGLEGGREQVSTYSTLAAMALFTSV
jgi:hypothetical protein